MEDKKRELELPDSLTLEIEQFLSNMSGKADFLISKFAKVVEECTEESDKEISRILDRANIYGECKDEIQIEFEKHNVTFNEEVWELFDRLCRASVIGSKT
ncbi:MAG: hypothetical protein FWD58_03830 [Firmicutes bacterium]|nr:hypothetical protein [Bacillota bacterium]